MRPTVFGSVATLAIASTTIGTTTVSSTIRVRDVLEDLRLLLHGVVDLVHEDLHHFCEFRGVVSCVQRTRTVGYTMWDFLDGVALWKILEFGR